MNLASLTSPSSRIGGSPAASTRVSGCLQSVLAPHGCKAQEELLDPGGLLPEITQLVSSKAQGMVTQKETTEEAVLKLTK